MTKDKLKKEIKIGDYVCAKLQTIGHDKELVGRVEDIDCDGFVKVKSWWVDRYKKVNEDYKSTGYWL